MTKLQPMSGNIYLVEDNDEVRTHLVKVLRHYGFQVEAFVDAAAFIRQAHYVAPAVIVSDMVMPGQSGLDLLAYIRKAGWTCPIIFISGLSQPHQIIEAMKQGAADFLWKPFTTDALLAAINNALLQETARHAAEQKRLEAQQRHASLTDREREICLLAIGGYGNSEISQMIDVQPDTVKKHRARVMEKMGASSLAELIALYEAMTPNNR